MQDVDVILSMELCGYLSFVWHAGKCQICYFALNDKLSFVHKTLNADQ